MRDSSSASVADRLEAEDLARARWYSFFSRWFLASPDRQAIDLFIPASAGALQSRKRAKCERARHLAPETRPSLHESLPADATNEAAASPWLASAWAAFASAVAGESLETIRSSYDDTFISVGEAPVSLHASVYLTGFANERPLAEVRQWLARQGIQSSREGLLTEDHLGLLCEAMAWLIVGRGDREAGAGDAAMAGGESREGAEASSSTFSSISSPRSATSSASG